MMKYILMFLILILSLPAYAEFASDARFGVSGTVAYVVDHDYVYNTIYFWDGVSWNLRQCTGTRITDDWNKDCYYDLKNDIQNLESGTYYVISYACTLQGSAYDCNDNKWLLASFDVTSGGVVPEQRTQCSDGVDNDNDGKIDLQDPGCSSSTDNDEYNYVGPPQGDGTVLQPGSGWSGATPTPGAYGGRTTKAIARWDVVPMQEVKSPMEVGVIAHHSYGIDRVEISLNNGPWISVREPTYNPRTKVDEYWVVFDPSKVSDGEVELRAIAYPKSGQPRVLNLDLWANAGGSINFPIHYIQPGDDSVPASVRAPKDRWLTVKYAPGASQRVWLPNRNDGGNIKLEGLNMRGPIGSWHGRCSGCKAWFDNVDYLGVPSSFESKPLDQITTIHTTFYDWWSVYYTDVDIDHVANPLGANSGFARNIKVGTAYEDPIRVCGMVVNYQVDNLIPGFPGYVNNDYVHTDMFQICEQFDTRNAIYQNIVGKNIRGQGMSLGNTYDSAFVNIDVDVIVNNIGFRLWGDQHNVFFKDISVRSPIGGEIAYRPDPFNGKDIVFRNVGTSPGSHPSITVFDR